MKSLTLNSSQRVIAIFALLFLTLGLQISVPNLLSPALAAGCPGGVVCVSTEAQATVGSGGSNAGNDLPGAGGVGGGNTAPPYVPKVEAQDGRFWDIYLSRSRFVKNWSHGTCGPITIAGIKVESVGSVIHEKSYYNNHGDNADWPYSGWHITGSTCVYPDVSSNVVEYTCLLSYTARIDRLAQSWLGAANGIGSTSGIITNVGDLEGSNGSQWCKQTASVAFDYNPPSGQNGWGQYRATSNIKQARCKFLTTVFEGVATTTGKCSPLGDVQGTVGKITVWCDGYSNSWVTKDWTGTDCKNSVNHPLVCKIPTPATYNGYSGNVQGIRDGENSLVKWGTPQVIGGWGMTNWRSSTVVNAGSTPRSTAVNDNSKNQQLFASSLNFSNGMTAGQNLNQQLAFYSAGDSGSPFSMTRNYMYDTWFKASHTTIRGLDLQTGAIHVSSYDEAAFAKNNRCGPQTSPRIDVIRAIGDTVN